MSISIQSVIEKIENKSKVDFQKLQEVATDLPRVIPDTRLDKFVGDFRQRNKLASDKPQLEKKESLIRRTIGNALAENMLDKLLDGYELKFAADAARERVLKALHATLLAL